jgi:hypothetical protein
MQTGQAAVQLEFEIPADHPTLGLISMAAASLPGVFFVCNGSTQLTPISLGWPGHATHPPVWIRFQVIQSNIGIGQGLLLRTVVLIRPEQRQRSFADGPLGFRNSLGEQVQV